MMKKKQEEKGKKFEVKKRTPKEKPNFFQNVTPFPHPVGEIFSHAVESAVKNTQPAQPNQPKPTAPEKDYTKTANSIVRIAVPERFFKGMSKNTYDALYLKTRGAINPVRKIRATKSDLIRWTGVSDVTLDKHVRHLKSVGLLQVDFVVGSHEGNWYEVFIPEEISMLDLPNQPNPTNPPNIPKKVGGDPPNLVGGVGWGELLENKEDSGLPKTSLKTNTISDDDALAKFAARMNEASRKLTKKGLKKIEEEKWEELAELLVMELEIAAARTKSISNVPAFLTEHLRRRLIGKSAAVEEKAQTSKTTKVGKPEEAVEEYLAESLTEQGREAVLKTMREFIGKGQKQFVMSQKDTYTKNDWEWLIKQLEKQ
jgi:hypothetical protein